MTKRPFAIGDRVRVCSKDFPTQNGLEGTVIDLCASYSLPIRIAYDMEMCSPHPYVEHRSITTNIYNSDDLILIDSVSILPKPEFDLDDMELAEILMEEMK